MAAELSKLEKETVLIFNERELICECFTYNPRLKRRLASLLTSRPDDVQKTRETSDGAIEYTFPKQWLRINAPRSMSEDEKEMRAAVLERNRSKQ